MKKLRLIAALLIAIMILSIPTFAAEKQGMTFKADTQYSAAKTFEQSPVTFEAWVNLPTTVTGRGGIILGSWGSGNKNVNFEVSDNGVPRFYVNDGAIDAKFTEVSINTGEWLHLAIVYRATQGAVLCYVNGQLKQTKTFDFHSPIDTTLKMCLGGDYRSGNEQHFKGQISSVAVYSDERTMAEIASDMNSYGTDGLIASYDTSVLSGVNIADRSGNGYDMIKEIVWIDGADMGPLPEFAYSFAVVGDTQRIAYNYKDRFGEIYDWILDNAPGNKTKFVMGLGDITETSSDEEWTIAMNAIKKLDGNIPYSLVRGNHDSVDSFNKYVKYDDYKNVVGGTYEGDMRNTYQKFSVGDVKYMVFTLDYGASNKVLAWAREIIESHPDHNVILTTHAYLYRDGTTLDADDICPPATTGGKNNGDHIWDKLASQCENIVLVLSGHDPCDNIIMTQDKGVHGNTVTQMLIDPQGADNTYGGLGAVAMFYFSEDGKDVTVRYFATLQDKYFMSASQFNMTLDVVGDGESDVPGDENNDQNSGENENNGTENTDDTTNNENTENNENTNDTAQSTEDTAESTSDTAGENTSDTAENNNSDDTQPSLPTDTQASDTTELPTQSTPVESVTAGASGCGSVISAGVVGVFALAALGMSFVPNKKRK